MEKKFIKYILLTIFTIFTNNLFSSSAEKNEHISVEKADLLFKKLSKKILNKPVIKTKKLEYGDYYFNPSNPNQIYVELSFDVSQQKNSLIYNQENTFEELEKKVDQYNIYKNKPEGFFNLEKHKKITEKDLEVILTYTIYKSIIAQDEKNRLIMWQLFKLFSTMSTSLLIYHISENGIKKIEDLVTNTGLMFASFFLIPYIAIGEDLVKIKYILNQNSIVNYTI